MKKILICIFAIFMTCAGWAKSHIFLSDSVKALWYFSRESREFCGYHNFKGCIGDSERDGCRPYGIAGGTNSSTYGMNVMLARYVKEHGAMFCPTQIDPGPSGWRLDTLYRQPSGSTWCRWLCREGWTGYGCEQRVNNWTGTCDVSPVLRSQYNTTAMHFGGENIEWEIPMFSVDNYICSGRHAEI